MLLNLLQKVQKGEIFALGQLHSHDNKNRICSKSSHMGHYALLTFFIGLPILFGEFLSVKRQPWPVRYDEIGSCCSLVESGKQHQQQQPGLIHYKDNSIEEESQKLGQCVSKLLSDRHSLSSSSSVAVASLAVEGQGRHRIDNLTFYRPYQQGIIEAYCEHHGYIFHSLEYLDPMVYPEEEDFRWHKIAILRSALNPVHGWAAHADYVLWIGRNVIKLYFIWLISPSQCYW